MAEPTCIHAVPQAADQLHGICIFCYRDRLGAARTESAALRERVAVLERVHAAVVYAAEGCCIPYYRGVLHDNLRDALESSRSALAAAKPAAQEGKEASDGS